MSTPANIDFRELGSETIDLEQRQGLRRQPGMVGPTTGFVARNAFEYHREQKAAGVSGQRTDCQNTSIAARTSRAWSHSAPCSPVGVRIPVAPDALDRTRQHVGMGGRAGGGHLAGPGRRVDSDAAVVAPAPGTRLAVYAAGVSSARPNSRA